MDTGQTLTRSMTLLSFYAEKSLNEKQTWSNVELEQLEFKIGVFLTERAEVDNLMFGRPIC